jgi:WD40 repeat protein
MNTGEKVIQFSDCHGNNEITAMTFDKCGRRLLTGGRDGSLKLWNFNNGECLRVLKNAYNAEVLSLLLARVSRNNVLKVT